MNRYEIENNSYYIFDKDTSIPLVHFLWGKFDFRLNFRKTDKAEAIASKKLGFRDETGTYFVADKLQHQRHGFWYDFQKVSYHGFTFEETEWIHDGKIHHAEFPKALFQIAATVSAKELGMKSINSF